MRKVALLIVFIILNVHMSTTASNINIGTFRKQITASSYYRNDYTLAPLRGNDGNADTAFLSDIKIDSMKAAWWQVDMGSSQNIVRLEIKPRKNSSYDERRNFIVYASNKEEFDSGGDIMVLAAQGTEPFDEDAGFVREIKTERKYRYIRIQKTQLNEVLGFSEFTAWVAGVGETAAEDFTDAVADPSWSNIAVAKTSKASSYYQNDENMGPAKGNDGSTNSFFVLGGAQEAGKLGWWQVDLSEEMELKRIEIVSRGNYAHEKSNFRIIASKNEHFSDYTELASQGTTAFDGNMWYMNINYKANYRYLRIEKTKIGETIGFSEFRVYADVPAEPAPMKVVPEMIFPRKTNFEPNLSGSIRIIWDGIAIFETKEIQMIDGKTFVPLATFVSTFDAQAYETPSGNTMLTKGGMRLEFADGMDKVLMNDISIESLPAPYTYADMLYIPLRLFAESMGVNVKWYEAENTIVLTSAVFDGASE